MQAEKDFSVAALPLALAGVSVWANGLEVPWKGQAPEGVIILLPDTPVRGCLVHLQSVRRLQPKSVHVPTRARKDGPV